MKLSRRQNLAANPYGNESPIVLVVDEDASVCESVKRVLWAEEIEVHTFSSAQPLLKFGCPNGPCCLILDAQMPGVGGAGCVDVLRHIGIRAPVVFITGHGDVSMCVRAMKAGAVDFLTKPFQAGDLLSAVRRALSIDKQLLARNRELAALRCRYQMLTDREREVLYAVTDGFLNKQVGSQLGVSEKTVKIHRGHVMQKMEAGSFAALVRMADALRLEPNDESVREDDDQGGWENRKTFEIDMPFLIPSVCV